MTNPQISFRLSAYQLAAGLKIIRITDPKYVPSSLSQLVKRTYIDSLSKVSAAMINKISETELTEITNLINKRLNAISLADFQSAIK